jgi:two-component system, OmpR family, sensor histidine kinase TctE
LANQLLTLARSEAATPSAQTKPVLVAQALASALARSAARAQSLDLELHYEEVGAAQSWQVQGDATLIEEAISNVIENAIAHAPAHSEVRCTADSLLREIRIADLGQGVDDAQAESLFQPFVRGAETPHTGTGLGLAIVREIMRRHGGDARFAVRTPGAGACMILSFPMFTS